MAERLAPLCPHVPARELAELTFRLAASELMRAGNESVSQLEDTAPATGNRVVWLPGASGVAIVLPAGEADPAPVPSQVLEFVRRLAQNARPRVQRAVELAARGSAVARERALVMLNAWQARASAELPER